MGRWKQVVSGTAGIGLVIGILIAANVIINQVRAFRLDLTEENLYTLSEGTRAMLGELERDVTLHFYRSRSSESIPIQLKQYAQRIEDLLREYAAHSNGRVALEVHDPKPDSDEEEWARKHGIAAQGMNLLGGEEIYLGLAAVSGVREGAIPFIDPGSEPRLEYLVTRLVYEVTATDRPKVGILSSLPMMGAPQAPFAQSPGSRPWYAVSELRQLYEVVEVSADAEELPEDLTLLILAHLREPSDALLFAIDQFVLGGGRVLAFVDPLCLADPGAQPQFQQFGPPQSASDLNRLTDAWGLRMDPASVVADPAAATQLSAGGGRVDRLPTWLSLRADAIDREEISTSLLEYVMMPFAGAWSGEPAEGLTMTRLIVASADAGTVNSFQAMAPSDAVLQAMVDQDDLPLAIRLQGRFPTAFPDGPPADEPDEEEGDAAEDGSEVEPEWLTEAAGDSVVILVADADLLADDNCVRTFSIFGQTVAEPLNDNLNMLLNFAEQLTGSEALIGLRSRGTYQRPFDRVLALQQEAQAKWQAEEQALQARLQDVQQRINELQRGKQADQQLILSPEQQQEIDRFDQELARTREQLKEVRKNLRRDIEMLGIRMKALNMAAVPALVAIGGIVHGLRRKKRAARAA